MVESTQKILKGKLTGGRLMGKSGLRWEDNIRMNLQVIGVSMIN